MKNGMLKKTTLAALLATSVFMMTACGSEDASETAPATEVATDALEDAQNVAEEATATEESTDALADGAEEADPTETEEDSDYTSAIETYLVEEIGPAYATGEICIPCIQVVAEDTTNPDETLVWGCYWVYWYNVKDDILECVSGGSHPGLMHVATVDGKFKVTSFDQVEDGSSWEESAKEIFGDHFADFQKMDSDSEAREQARGEWIAKYVEKNGLSVTQYQDYGWDPVAIPQ
ncbi:MAG: hypothetical protein K6G07_02205 [Lachnospiraceae bacterium]|nr:hypothetical protein [Lachnospiraceae bacterium]